MIQSVANKESGTRKIAVKFTIDDLLKSKDFKKYNRHFAAVALKMGGNTEYTKADAEKIINDFMNRKLN